MRTEQKWMIGDCLKWLPEVPDKSVDMILTDLPYGTTQCRWDTIIPLRPLWQQYMRIISDIGAIVLFASQPFTSKLIMSNLNHFKYQWVWEKDNSKATNFVHAKNSPLKIHEDICVFSTGIIAHKGNKKRMTYNPQDLVPYGRVVKGNNKGGKYDEHKMNRPSHKEKYVREYTGYPIDIIRFATDFKQMHPTQKPIALCEYLIKTYTNEGDTVHDSCLGSGTTLEACANTNRNCIGFEIDPQWEPIYRRRLRLDDIRLDAFNTSARPK